MSGGGGKGSKDQKVPTIDPIALIDAQTKANRVGVNTPFGSQAYSTDANGNAVLNTQLSPEMQALLTQQIGKASSSSNPYVLPGQNASILNGLNTRLDQRYGMGLPPAGGNTGGGNTTPPPGGGGGTPPVTPPTSPPPPGAGGPGPSPGNNTMFPGTTPKDWMGERGRFSMDGEPTMDIISAHQALGQPGYLGPGAWASQGAYGAGQGSDAGGSYGGSYTPGMGSTGNNFGIPMPGSGTGNYSDPSSGMPGSLPGGYLGSGSYSGMGAGLGAAANDMSGFGLPSGSVDLSGGVGSGYNSNYGSTPDKPGNWLTNTANSILDNKATGPVSVATGTAPILGIAKLVRAIYRATHKNDSAPASSSGETSFYNYNGQ